MNSAEILDAAIQAVTKDRAATHGKPDESLALIAEFWSAYVAKRFGGSARIDAVDVASMMVLFKLSRAMMNPRLADNWIDLGGYGAIAGHIATETKTPTEGLTFDQHMAKRYPTEKVHAAWSAKGDTP